MYLNQTPARPPRKAPPGYAWEWEPGDFTPGMAGLGKFKLKKIFKAVGKIALKVAPIAAAFIPGIGPVAAGALAAAAKAVADKKAVAKSASDLATAQAQADAIAAAAAAAAATPGQSAAQQQATQTAAAFAASAAQQAAAGAPLPVYRPATYAPAEPADEYEPSGRSLVGRPAAGLPAWAIPAGIAALAALFLLRKR